MTTVRRLYDRTMSLAASPAAPVWLAVIAFVESSVFLVPADVLYIPMSLADRSRRYRYALIATVASVLGGIVGWAIGFYAYEAIARPVLEFYGKLAAFEALRGDVDSNWILLLMITSGFAHLPPIKLVTILAGVVKMNLASFILTAAVTRGLRFFVLAYLIGRFGSQAVSLIERRSGYLITIPLFILVAYLLYRLSH